MQGEALGIHGQNHGPLVQAAHLGLSSPLGLQIAQRRSYSYTSGSQAGIILTYSEPRGLYSWHSVRNTLQTSRGPRPHTSFFTPRGWERWIMLDLSGGPRYLQLVITPCADNVVTYSLGPPSTQITGLEGPLRAPVSSIVGLSGAGYSSHTICAYRAVYVACYSSGASRTCKSRVSGDIRGQSSRSYLERQWPVILGYFQWTMGYFRISWPIILGYLAFKVPLFGLAVGFLSRGGTV